MLKLWAWLIISESKHPLNCSLLLMIHNDSLLPFHVFVYFIPDPDNQSFSLEEMKNHFKMKTFNLI